MLGCIGLADNVRNAREHVVERWAVGRCGSLGVRFLQEPEFFECDNGVSAGDLKIELVVWSVVFVLPYYLG